MVVRAHDRDLAHLDTLLHRGCELAIATDLVVGAQIDCRLHVHSERASAAKAVAGEVDVVVIARVGPLAQLLLEVVVRPFAAGCIGNTNTTGEMNKAVVVAVAAGGQGELHGVMTDLGFGIAILHERGYLRSDDVLRALIERRAIAIRTLELAADRLEDPVRGPLRLLGR